MRRTVATTLLHTILQISFIFFVFCSSFYTDLNELLRNSLFECGFYLCEKFVFVHDSSKNRRTTVDGIEYLNSARTLDECAFPFTVLSMCMHRPI